MIYDRILLGVVAGTVGNLAKTAVDEVSLRLKVSQRSFRATAAGVWLPSARQVDTPMGQLLGGMMDFGMAMLGGIGIVQVLTHTGRDQVLVKGLASGITLGSAITAMTGTLSNERVKPKDAASNLSYLISHAVFGLVAAAAATKLGHDSLFVRPRALEPVGHVPVGGHPHSTRLARGVPRPSARFRRRRF